MERILRRIGFFSSADQNPPTATCNQPEAPGPNPMPQPTPRQARTRNRPPTRLAYTRHASAGDGDDVIVNPAWNQFKTAMVWIGGIAVLAWIFGGGYLAGRPSMVSQQTQQVVTNHAQVPTATQQTALEQGAVMTTETIKEALTEAGEILSATNVVRGQVKEMAQAELPPTPPSPPPSVEKPNAEPPPAPPTLTDAQQRNEALKQRLRERYDIK